MGKTIQMTAADSNRHKPLPEPMGTTSADSSQWPAELKRAFDTLGTWLGTSVVVGRQLERNVDAFKELEALVEKGKAIMAGQEALLLKLWNDNQALLAENTELKAKHAAKNAIQKLRRK